MAARAAAENGADVIFIEEHPEAGKPVSCAEGLSMEGIRDAGLEPGSGITCQAITIVRVIAPNGNTVELTREDWVGFILDREVFDRTLAENAVKAGARLMTSTTATGVIREDGVVRGVYAERGGEALRIEAEVVIGADGHASIIRRSAGLGRWFTDVVTCAQYQLGGLSLEEPHVNEFYLGEDNAPGGYAWVFPKSREVANVGLGVRVKHTEPPIEYLNRFVERDPRFKDAEILKTNGGICPVSGQLKRIVDDGLMLIGDAAGQLIPMTGAGIHPGIESGKIAGEVAAKAVKEGDVSASRLMEYRNRFDKYWGKRIKDSRRVVEMFDKFSDEDLNTLAEVITNEDISDLVNGTNVAGAVAGIIARSPGKIIRLMGAYLR